MTKNLPLLSPNTKKMITQISKNDYTDENHSFHAFSMEAKLNRQKGLTLVEILVSTLLMAILAVTLIFVFRSGQTTWGKTKRGTAIYQNARVALGEMSRGLSGALISEDNVIYFLGFASQVEFVCSLESDEGDKYDLREIGYYRNNEDELMRRMERNPNFTLPEEGSHGGGSSSDLAFQVTALEFKYWDETTTSWLDSWDSRTGGKLPQVVKISVTVQEDVSQDPISKTFDTVVYLFNSQG